MNISSRKVASLVERSDNRSAVLSFSSQSGVGAMVGVFELNSDGVVGTNVGNDVGTQQVHVIPRFMPHPALLSVRCTLKVVPLCLIANWSPYT